jgi:RNA polymerase sigma factor (sigma-70 family)
VNLEAIVAGLVRRVLGYAVLRTGDAALAEDIAQESLAALVHYWRRHGPPRSPDGFVFAVARRRAARALLRRRLWLPLEHLRHHRDNAPGPEARLIAQGDRVRLAGALARINRTDRDLLLLLAVGEVRPADAARLLGISPGAVKMRALRARRRLKQILEHDDEHQRRP